LLLGIHAPPSFRASASEIPVAYRKLSLSRRQALTVRQRDPSQVTAATGASQPRNDLTRAARDRRLVEQLDRWLTEAVHPGYSADEVLRLVAKRVGEFQWQADGAA